MYTTILALSMLSADHIPQGIFHRGNCSGTVSSVAMAVATPVRNAVQGLGERIKNRPHLALVHNVGCSAAQRATGCNGSTTVSMSTSVTQKLPVAVVGSPSVATVNSFGAGPLTRLRTKRLLKTALESAKGDQKVLAKLALDDPDVMSALSVKVHQDLSKQTVGFAAFGDGHWLKLFIDNLPAIIDAIKQIKVILGL